MIKMGAEDLSTKVLNSEVIYEVIKYDFNIPSLNVTPLHMKLPSQ